jgi:FHA domain
MSRFENVLGRIEARLKEAIEGANSLEGIPCKFYKQLVHALALAMRSGATTPPAMAGLAPDQYTLILPVERAQELLSHPNLLDQLASRLAVMAHESGIQLSGTPIIQVVPDPDSREVSVLAEYSRNGMSDSYTTEMGDYPRQPKISHNGHMPKAFLIVNGLSTFQLSEPVVNIGSDNANQLVLRHSSVSRRHAQLRLMVDRFAIFDLGSKNGTLVNGMAVSSQVLSPGDVIKLAGVPLVYGQEMEPNAGYTEKLPVFPPSPEVI